MSRPQIPGSAGSAGQPRQMSSRLLTMKFMQRAAAGSPLSTVSLSNKFSQTPDERSPKRQRLGESTPSSTPISASGNVTPDILPESAFADRAAIDAALKAEAEARAAARSRNVRDGDETEWVLNLPSTQINGHTHTNGQSNGYTEVAEDEDIDDIWHPSNILSGRQTYGNFTRRKLTQTSISVTADENDLSSVSDQDSEGDLTTPLRPSNRQVSGNSDSRKRSRANSHDEEREGRRMDSLDLKGMSGISGSATGKAVAAAMAKMTPSPKSKAKKKWRGRGKGNGKT